MNEANVRDVWGAATNSVCQTLQDEQKCLCEDGKCVAARVKPDPVDITYFTGLERRGVRRNLGGGHELCQYKTDAAMQH